MSVALGVRCCHPQPVLRRLGGLLRSAWASVCEDRQHGRGARYGAGNAASHAVDELPGGACHGRGRGGHCGFIIRRCYLHIRSRHIE